MRNYQKKKKKPKKETKIYNKMLKIKIYMLKSCKVKLQKSKKITLKIWKLFKNKFWVCKTRVANKYKN